MAVISKDLGAVTAYAAAVNRGYTGTKEEFETLMASYATVAQQAAESAQSAEQSAQSASGSATDAQTAQASAQGYAQSAQQSAQSASQSAQSAENAKNTAVDAVDGFASGAQQALDGVNQAGNNWKSLAQAKALDSEAWAVGKRGGEDVGSSDPAYHNNAKYYAESVSASAQTASEAAQTATAKASEAQASASAAAESASDVKDVKGVLKIAEEQFSDINLWESGTYSPSDGSSQGINTRMRTKDYLDGAITGCECGSDYYIIVCAWNGSGEYIGEARSDFTFEKRGGALFQEFSFTQYADTDYKFKIVARRVDNAVIPTSETVNYVFEKKTSAVDSLPYGLDLLGKKLSLVGADGSKSEVELPTNGGDVSLTPSKNLGFTWEINGINLDTGEDQVFASRKRSQYVPVEEGKTYSFNVAESENAYAEYVFYYTAEKTPILIDTTNNRYYTRMTNGFFPKTLTIPTGFGIAYIRMMLNTLAFDAYNGQAEENVMSTSYRSPEASEIPNAYMPNNVSGYIGKNVLLLGDSITAQDNWSKFFEASVKPSNLYNYAVGGATWCDPQSGIIYDGTSGTYNVLGNQVKRAVDNNLQNIDCIIILAGTNDTNVTFPTDADVENAFFDASMNPVALADADRTTWQGAMRWSLETLILKYPNAKIFVCSPVQRIYKSAEPTLSLYSTIKGKGETIQKMARRMGVEFVDTEQCGISACRSLYFADGLHPLKRSAEKIARYIIARYMAWFCQD